MPEGYNPRCASTVPHLHKFRLVRGVLVFWSGDTAAHTKSRVRSHRDTRLLRVHRGLERAGGAHPPRRNIVSRHWQLEGGSQADRVEDRRGMQAALLEGLLFITTRSTSCKEIIYYSLFTLLYFTFSSRIQTKLLNHFRRCRPKLRRKQSSHSI